MYGILYILVYDVLGGFFFYFIWVIVQLFDLVAFGLCMEYNCLLCYWFMMFLVGFNKKMFSLILLKNKIFFGGYFVIKEKCFGCELKLIFLLILS
jgi:hypothetical protein